MLIVNETRLFAQRFLGLATSGNAWRLAAVLRLCGLFTAILALIPLISCGPQGQREICVDDHNRRKHCSPKEKAMIDGMEAIISQVRYFNSKTIDKSFKQIGDKLDVARILFFGEEHTEIISQIETLGAINALALPGDMILLEGADRESPIRINCGLYMILALYLNWQWEKLGEFYDVANVKNKSQWIKNEGFGNLFGRTSQSYDISDLTISRVSCGYWDDRDAIAQTLRDNAVTTVTLEKRNKSMAEALRWGLKKTNGRVIVNTGLKHMPNVDYKIAEHRNQKNAQFPKGLPQFYRTVRNIRQGTIKGNIEIDDSSGTTEPIFEYLEKNHIPYREYIHRKLYR